MAINLDSETLFPLRMAPGHLPPCRGGRKLSLSTLYRWANRGLRGVRLETIQVGGTVCTSREALQRFFQRLSTPDEQFSAPTKRTDQATADAEAW